MQGADGGAQPHAVAAHGKAQEWGPRQETRWCASAKLGGPQGRGRPHEAQEQSSAVVAERAERGSGPRERAGPMASRALKQAASRNMRHRCNAGPAAEPAGAEARRTRLACANVAAGAKIQRARQQAWDASGRGRNRRGVEQRGENASGRFEGRLPTSIASKACGKGRSLLESAR